MNKKYNLEKDPKKCQENLAKVISKDKGMKFSGNFKKGDIKY